MLRIPNIILIWICAYYKFSIYILYIIILLCCWNPSVSLVTSVLKPSSCDVSVRNDVTFGYDEVEYDVTGLLDILLVVSAWPVVRDSVYFYRLVNCILQIHVIRDTLTSLLYLALVGFFYRYIWIVCLLLGRSIHQCFSFGLHRNCH